MLLQKCLITTSEGPRYIKGLKTTGEMELTREQLEALVWPNHFWSEMITLTHISQYKPHLIDVSDATPASSR